MGVVGLPAVELSRLVRQGTLSPVEVVAAHLAHVERVEPQVGAFRVVRGERALDEARELGDRPDLADLPLAGVPVAVKDNVALAGEARRHGCAATPDLPQTADHEVARRLRDAGAIVLGVTRMPELGVWGTTEGTRNPWRLDRTPGGSSGGSAAAVASAMVPLAHANDGLGSIRIPAACCGVAGIKPGRGVVPGGINVSDWFTMAENGPIAATVADVAMGLAVMAGRPDLAAAAPARPDPGVSSAPGAGRLTVAVSLRAPLPGLAVDPEWRGAALRVAAMLQGVGHQVDQEDPPLPVRSAGPIVARWYAGVAQDSADLDRARLQRRTRMHGALGRLALRTGMIRAGQVRRVDEGLQRFFSRYDLLVTPTLAQPPIAAEGWEDRGWMANVNANTRYAPMCAPWNFVRYPAAAVPAGFHSDGTPLSVQLVALPGREALLLAVARLIESECPWPRHAPLASPAAAAPR